MAKNDQAMRLQRFIKKFGVADAEVEIADDASTILMYHGVRLLLKPRTLMSVDTMKDKYRTEEMLYLPEFSYQLLVWLNKHGYENEKFKYVEHLPLCWLCHEHFHKTIPACFIVKTRTGLQSVCPVHGLDYEIVQILIERKEY